MPLFAVIAVDTVLNSCAENDLFDYIIPDELKSAVEIGMRVIVPFSGRMLEGYVINIKDSTDVARDKLKAIKSIPNPSHIFDHKQISLAKWMSKEYLCSITECLKCIMPSEMVMKESKYVVVVGGKSADLSNLKHDDEKILDIIKSHGGRIKVNDILKLLGRDAKKTIERLVKSEVLAIKSNMAQEVSAKKIKGIDLNLDYDSASSQADSFEKKSSKFLQAKALRLIMSLERPFPERELVEKYKLSRSTINTLVKKGILKSVEIEISRNPYGNRKFSPYVKPTLTDEQRDVLNTILTGYYGYGKRNFLIHGVTGSGKTEVYMRLAEHMIEKGKQTIVLVPEIALTPQTIERFKGRFERVAVLHSRLSAGERYDEWMRIKRGEVDVVVGARSAVFAPVSKLGAIIIDEEHETSYKSDKTPKYHARDIAQKRCEIEDAILVLGSATPCIETYYNANNKKYIKCNMFHRIDEKSLPDIRVADMRQEIDSGNMTIFSRMLYSELKNVLRKKQQAILFLNRRGYSTFVSCRKCGSVMKCPRCDVSLTYHADRNVLNCHYCGYTASIPKVCPVCGSKYIKYFGIGTQKVENEVKRFFPEARVLRMDMDTTSRKGAHGSIYRAFKNHEADILIGTQMVSKGLDFPGVTLVGIIAADLSINIPDFRSGERTFQLITQVSGRAGRGSEPGKVIIQTYNPKHYSILASLHQDYNEFFEKEISMRKTFEYPPFSDIVNIVASSKNENEAIKVMNDITAKLKQKIEGNGFDANVLGPTQAPISKINTYYRWQTIIKGRADDSLKRCVKSIIDEAYPKSGSVKINLDINPVSLA
jgi:primosomal protein N' (replication factor Y)